MEQQGPPSSVQAAIAALRRGELIVVVDSRDHGNEGDLVAAAETAGPKTVNFMATHGRGLICVPMLRARLDALGIPPMVANDDPHATAFHVGVDHVSATTGISAYERAHTIQALAHQRSGPADFTQPGHVFPLAYCDGGVFRRAGHTEAAVDLVQLAGLQPAAVACAIARSDGEMAQLSNLVNFAAQHGLVLTTIADLIAYRRGSERPVERVSQARMPLPQGTFMAIGYRDLVDDTEHIALVIGDVADGDDVLVHLHEECPAGDIFGSHRCACGTRLTQALEVIAEAGRGAVIYLRNPVGRGTGVLKTLDTCPRQNKGADRRDRGTSKQILDDLGVPRGIPPLTAPSPDNVRYLAARPPRLEHRLEPVVHARTGA